VFVWYLYLFDSLPLLAGTSHLSVERSDPLYVFILYLLRVVVLYVHFIIFVSSFLASYSFIVYHNIKILLFIHSSFIIPFHFSYHIIGILHTIIFTRAFGLVRPSEVQIEFLEVFYVKCDDKSLEMKIEEKTEEFVASFSKRKTKKGQV
jgi:hypothetical protein